MSNYYVSGCIDVNGDVSRCDDSAAQFWTLYHRNDDGLSEGIIDCVFREDAEAAMRAYEERDALAAENVALIRAFMPKEIPTEATDNFSDTAVLRIDGDEFHSWQWVDNQDEVIRGVLNFFKPKTPTTDAYLNSVRAELIPEGYVIAPQQMHLSADAMESLCFHCGDGGFAFGDFTDGILWVGDIENDDGTKTYGLNIATAEYPEEGSANISEFAAQLRAGEPS